MEGPSHSGKTEFAKSLFNQPLELKIGNSEVFPARMRTFDDEVHDALILDDVRDYEWLVLQQDKLQGKYDTPVEFSTTPGGELAFVRDLFAIPIVVTTNFSTRNRHLLESDDFLKLEENRVLINFQHGDHNFA